MKQYHDLLKEVLEKGERKEDRTGVGTLSLFGAQMKFNLDEGFPLVTTKKVHLKSIIHELLWFISGSTNVKYLQENGVRIWNEWADEKGELGPVYGKQWRGWQAYDVVGEDVLGSVKAIPYQVDQLKNVIERIRTKPTCRRLIVSSWNPGEIKDMALPPCHCFFQFQVSKGRLNCQLYQRSCDMFLGVPFNIASYALLTMMVAKVTNLQPGTFVHTLGDYHIYLNHLDQVKEQLSREPRELPVMSIRGEQKEIDDFQYSNFVLSGYNPHPPIKAEVAV